MNYIELVIYINERNSQLREIITALLSESGYNSFKEESHVIYAYISEKSFNKKYLTKILNKYKTAYSINIIKEKKWEKEWEKTFQPVVIDNELIIRSPYHCSKKDVKYDLIIEPKMSFGTGHHETTLLMCKLILESNMLNTAVLDIGCGTGILGILAEKTGAGQIICIDIDKWAYENSIENIKINNCKNIKVFQGDFSVIPKIQFDYILSNINFNVLMEDIPEYSKILKHSGTLIISGFFTKKSEKIKNQCIKNGLVFVRDITKNDWSACVFIKD